MIATKIATGLALFASALTVASPAEARTKRPTHPATPAPVTTPAPAATPAPTAAPATGDLVVNGSGSGGTIGWSGGSQAGALSVRQVSGVTGFSSGTGGIQISRSGGTGSWASALSALRSPETTFVVGQTYRMQAWVRDLNGAGSSIGMLIANGHYANRPTEVSQYTTNRDTSWHQITRTFMCTAPAAADTALYFDLPHDGAFNIQITGASVQAVDAPLPATVASTPTKTISFTGAAGSQPSSTAWNFETGGNGWGNGELQTYTSKSTNAQLDGNGRLSIIARKENVTGTDGIARNFTSARLTSQNKVTIAPGSYVETSIVAPTGDGAWPAFWLLGTNISSVGWPASGEIDVLEGFGTHPDSAFAALHMGTTASADTHAQYGWGEAGGTTDIGQPLDTKAHLYGVYFDAKVVRFYIDRKPTMTIWAQDAAAVGRAWPFGAPQFVVLNVAVPGDTQATTASFPKTMSVGPISAWAGGIPFV
jgi:beta-glucanase (GH16 family)